MKERSEPSGSSAARGVTTLRPLCNTQPQVTMMGGFDGPAKQGADNATIGAYVSGVLVRAMVCPATHEGADPCIPCRRLSGGGAGSTRSFTTALSARQIHSRHPARKRRWNSRTGCRASSPRSRLFCAQQPMFTRLSACPPLALGPWPSARRALCRLKRFPCDRINCFNYKAYANVGDGGRALACNNVWLFVSFLLMFGTIIGALSLFPC
jgi:hypothetical protein